MLDFFKIEFGFLSVQKRKVRIYIFLHLSKGKKFSSPLPLFINPGFWQDKNQRVNPRYKEAEKTAHDLRRSFATNYYSKVETPILMRITGYKKESTFLEYIGESFNQDHYADLFIQQISS